MMSLLIIVAVLLFIPMLLGMLLHKVMREKKKNKTITYLMGVLVLFFIFEIIITIGIKLDLAFTVVFTIFIAICFVMIIVSLSICRKEITNLTLEFQEQRNLTMGRIMIVIIFLLLCINFFVYEPSNVSDAIEETVRTTLSTDTIFQYNPLTGWEMINGMHPITKFSTLPVFYAGIQQISGIPVNQLLYQVVPIWILFMSFLVFYQWGCRLFNSEKKKNAFIICYGMLLLFAEEGATHFSFRILHNTWLGNTIVVGVVIPFLVFMGITLWEERKIKYGLVCFVLFLVTTLTMLNTTTMGKDVYESIIASKGKIVAYLLIVLVYGFISGRFQKRKTAICYCFLIVGCLILGLWILAVAFVMSDVFRFIPKKRQWQTALGIAFIIVISGSIFLYQNNGIDKKVENTTEEAIIDVVEQIEKEWQKDIILVAPNFIMQQVRKHSGTILLPYGKDFWIEDVNKEIGDYYDYNLFTLYGSMLEIEKDCVKTFELAEEAGCNILISPILISEENLKINWNLYQEVLNYYIYTR